jgi:hypothetical protein
MWEGGISDQWHIIGTAVNYKSLSLSDVSGCVWKSHGICMEKSVSV